MNTTISTLLMINCLNFTSFSQGTANYTKTDWTTYGSTNHLIPDKAVYPELFGTVKETREETMKIKWLSFKLPCRETHRVTLKVAGDHLRSGNRILGKSQHLVLRIALN
jgi:hypothetical protein